MPQYQIIDPNFNKAKLGGCFVTTVDGIMLVTMKPNEAQYWLSQGAIEELAVAGAIRYPMKSNGIQVAALGVAAPVFAQSS
jgi:hypothetical protein